MTRYVSFGCKFFWSWTHIIRIWSNMFGKWFCLWVHDSVLIIVTSSIACSIICCWCPQTMSCWCLNPVRLFGVIPCHQKDFFFFKNGVWEVVGACALTAICINKANASHSVSMRALQQRLIKIQFKLNVPYDALQPELTLPCRKKIISRMLWVNKHESLVFVFVFSWMFLHVVFTRCNYILLYYYYY